MNKNKRISKKTIKTKLFFSCIVLILIGTITIVKSFPEEDVNAEPVTIAVTTTINGGSQKNNEISNKPIKITPEHEQVEKIIYDAEKVSSIVAYKEKNAGNKIAFLTFDDGPSTTVTPIVLDTLKQYNIKATFFLLGENIEKNEKSKELVKREFNEGHAIGNHTYSHNRGRLLFPNNKVNVPVFMDDVNKNDKALKNILSNGFNTRLLRLPGGYMSRTYYRDPNLPELNARLSEKNIISIDWNIEIGDAAGTRNKSSKELLTILKEQVGTTPKVIILMHDTYGKMQTANALPQIIQYLKEQGYDFGTIK
ncbi:polysaccharide deacetylase family protein [Clostridium sp.]|jgi:peptidoglycan/xylan/chitin deacetylase (PgdA/CDA1 family)|uniref:polysaccharide deacetylase family protein n=1 Tax=Clostridium sp. TaxID=1506 RepID=UPI003EE8DEA1